MKISELIKALQSVQNEHGDMDVYTESPERWEMVMAQHPITGVDIIKKHIYASNKDVCAASIIWDNTLMEFD